MTKLSYRRQRRPMNAEEKADSKRLPDGSRAYRYDNLMSQSVGREKGEGAASWFPVKLKVENSNRTFETDGKQTKKE